jgi:acyl transferase domain-containing protein
MACAAHRQTFGERPRRIRNLIWAMPITSQTRSDITVKLTQGDGVTNCEITTHDLEQAAAIHAQCKMYRDNGAAAQPAPLDLDAIRTRFTKQTSKAQCYDMLGQLQFRYGECLQAIAGVYHDETEGLTKLILPDRLRGEFDYYELHPSLMDGAVQSIISVVQNEAEGPEGYTPYVPFVVAEIEIFDRLTPICYAYIRLRRGTRDVSSIKKVDVTLTDETGRILADIRDFALKSFSVDEIAAITGPAPGGAADAGRVAPMIRDIPTADIRPGGGLAREVYLTAAWE